MVQRLQDLLGMRKVTSYKKETGASNMSKIFGDNLCVCVPLSSIMALHNFLCL